MIQVVSDHLDRIVDLILVVGPAFVWFVRWTRRLEGTVNVAKDVSTKHLPFIYTRLKTHDEALTLDNPEHPNIVLVPNGSK